MKIPCSSCNQRLDIPEELAGSTIECPACNASLAVPAMAAPAPVQVQQSAPQAASSEKSKSPIVKWAIASVVIIVVVVVGLIMFFPDDPNGASSSEPTVVKTDGKPQQSSRSTEAKPVETVAEAATQVPKTAKPPDMPIQIAAQSGHIELVKQHIAAGTDVNAKDKTGGTALISATLNGQKEIIELLIANKADLNIGLAKGKWTALHFASTPMSTKGFSDLEILEVLLKSGAAVNATDEEGQTPLDVVISSVGGQFLEDNNTHTPVTNLLRKHGGKTGDELKAEGK